MTEKRLPWRFQPGHAGGPGRPKGSKTRLGEAFIQALADDFDQHGVAVIENVRAEQPVEYLKVIARVLPKDVNINADATDRFLEALELLDRTIPRSSDSPKLGAEHERPATVRH